MTHLQTLRERASYLGKRIEAKQAVGWDTEYDMRERAALLWAIGCISLLEQPPTLRDLCAQERVRLTVDDGA